MSTLIITITYNSSKKVRSYLSSIKSFLSNENRLLIIENNSPDKNTTKKIIIDWIKENTLKSKYIDYVERENLGFGVACNYGVNKYKGKFEYVLFLNPDVVLKKDSLNNLVEHADQEKADVTGSKLLNADDLIQKSVFNAPNIVSLLFEFTNLKKIFRTKIGENNFYKDIEEIDTDTSVNGVSGACMLFRYSSFKKLHGFDERFFMYLEDVDLCVRARKIGMKILYCPHSILFHEGGASSDNKQRILHKAWFDSRREYTKKHFSIFVNLILQPIYAIEELILLALKKYPITHARH